MCVIFKLFVPNCFRRSCFSMSEYITIQIGQCGNQIGSSFWKCALQEYGVQVPRDTGFIPRNQHFKIQADLEMFHSFFWCPNGIPEGPLTLKTLEKASIKARALCIDMEDSVVNRFRKSSMRCLFDDTCLITNYPGSGNNWAEGYMAHGRNYQHVISEKIRKSMERCDAIHGFLLLYSMGGGTGSGLGSRVLSLLEEQFPHIDRVVTPVYPAGNEDVITAPYNVALATSELVQRASCVFPVNNKALSNICCKLKLHDAKKPNPKNFQDLNTVIVNMLLHITSGSRFPGDINIDMSDISMNLVPFPKMQFLNVGVSPLSTVSMKLPPPGATDRVDEIFAGTWSRMNQLISIDPLSGLLLATAFMTRGDVPLAQFQLNIEKFQQKRGKFFSGCTEFMKIGMCRIPPPGHKVSMTGIFNSTAMSNLYEDVITQFTKLFRRKAHVHHYTQVEGFELDHFKECVEELKSTTELYNMESIEKISASPLKVLC